MKQYPKFFYREYVRNVLYIADKLEEGNPTATRIYYRKEAITGLAPLLEEGYRLEINWAAIKRIR